jgi:hypothetical protein
MEISNLNRTCVGEQGTERGTRSFSRAVVMVRLSHEGLSAPREDLECSMERVYSQSDILNLHVAPKAEGGQKSGCDQMVSLPGWSRNLQRALR